MSGRFQAAEADRRYEELQAPSGLLEDYTSKRMGEYTGLVLFGFLAAHAAFILDLVSISSPRWVEGEHIVNSTTNQTEEVHKGLWMLCDGDSCSRLNTTLQYPYWKALEGLSVVSTGGLLLGLLATYIMLLMTSMEGIKSPACSLFFFLLSAFASLTVVIIFPIRFKKQDDLPEDVIPMIGWCYWLMVCSSALSFVTVFTSLKHICKISKKRRGYEDL